MADQNKNKILTIMFFIVLADMIGFGFVIPLLPYYAKQFGATDLLIGLLGSVYPLGQIFASPLIGRLSDKIGRKKALLLSVGGTFTSLLILGFARSLSLIFLSRLTDGLTGGNITVAQSYISDLTDQKDRAKSLGMIGAAFGLGFIIGPALGGFLSRFGVSVPAFVAAGLSFTNLMMIIFLLPESKPENSRRVPFTFEEMKKTVFSPQMRPLIFIKLFYSFGFTTFESTFALFAMKRLSSTLSTTSFILTYIGILVVFSQGFLVGKIAKRYAETNILRLIMPLVAPFMFLYSISKSVPVLLFFITPISLGSALIGVSFTSLITKRVSKDKFGGTIGFFNSIDSLMRILSPVLGGAIIQFLGPALKGTFEGIFIFLAFLILILFYIPITSKEFGRES